MISLTCGIKKNVEFIETVSGMEVTRAWRWGTWGDADQRYKLSVIR